METRPHFKVLFPTILGIMVIGLISTDIYLPSLPAIGKDFSSPNSLVKLTLSLYMLSFSLSQMIYGPLSDRHGRRKIILSGISFSLIGTLICAVSPDIAALIVGRLLQGLGLGAGPAVGRAVFRDVYSGNDLAHYGSYIAVGSAAVMAAAPTLGGYIQRYLGWRFSFVFLILFTLLILLMVYYWFNETHKEFNPVATKFTTMMKNYFHLLTSPIFMGYTGCIFLAFAGFGAYLAVSPFLFQEIIGLSPVEYGWLAFIIAIGLASGGYFNSLFVKKIGRHIMLRVGILLIIVSALLMLFLSTALLNTFVVMLPMFLYIFGAALVFANAYAGAFQPFAKMAGFAGALYGSIQIFGATISTAIVATIPEKSQIPLGIILLIIGILSYLLQSIAYRFSKKLEKS